MKENGNVSVNAGSSPIMESYNPKESYLYDKTYLFIKGYATGRNFSNTLIALPLARSVHDGNYRKGLVCVDGQMVRLPYVLHVLKVCSTLMSLNLPLSDDELDILYASALLHDALEDGEFPNGGSEFETDFGLDPRVRQVVILLSKHQGATASELNSYFNRIQRNKLALLIKMADRSHNVEDLYNIKNVPKYIKETRDYFLSSPTSIATYGKQHYPELSNGITILKAKILSLTEATETLMERYEQQLREKDEQIRQLQAELGGQA